MERRFRERLFVSLPFRATDGQGRRVTPAVLNVNVDAADVAVWRRAYHPEWLVVARDRAQAFVEIAYGSLLLILAGSRASFPRILLVCRESTRCGATTCAAAPRAAGSRTS